MGTPSRAEVEAAFRTYLQVGAFDRNWNAWADLFTEDAYYYSGCRLIGFGLESADDRVLTRA